MSFFKVAFLELRGRKLKTIILFGIFSILFTGILTTLVLLHSTQQSKDTILENIGATVTIDYAEISEYGQPIFTSEIRELLFGIENVIGINQNRAEFAKPLDFDNNKTYEGKDPYSQEVQIENEEGFENNVVLEGNINAELTDVFRNDVAELVAGAYPTDQERGALISQVLAEQNRLKVGDKITLSTYGNEISMTVVGIYSTKAHFRITSDNIVGAAVFAYSPYNRIYVDIGTFAEAYQYDRDTLPIDVYVDSPINIQKVGEAIKAENIDWEVFQLLNTTDNTYEMSANNIESISHIAELFSAVLTVVAVLIIVLVMSIWSDKFRYEGGIFLAMGASKWRTVMVLVISSLYVAVPALTIALLVAKPLASLALDYQMGVTEGRSEAVQQFITGVEQSTSITIEHLDVAMYMSFLGFVLIVVLIACLLPMYAVMKLKPREILTRK